MRAAEVAFDPANATVVAETMFSMVSNPPAMAIRPAFIRAFPVGMPFSLRPLSAVDRTVS